MMPFFHSHLACLADSNCAVAQVQLQIHARSDGSLRGVAEEYSLPRQDSTGLGEK